MELNCMVLMVKLLFDWIHFKSDTFWLKLAGATPAKSVSCGQCPIAHCINKSSDNNVVQKISHR